ncbi:MAG TPA: sigma-70 family RNA polymerase sigma factor [Solirubrobacterales bacterium]|nr:sigma-70 family RNA polymerase sigma factor [Solirubrobacterales bacterium]
MEAASAAGLLRARRFERECERLRPLGEAYVLRHFGEVLIRADAEDVVAEVLIRVHRYAQEGRPLDNLRAMFFTSVRNATIDLLRSRAARPQTVALEAARETPALAPAPPERAEGHENVVRLQEALARMRDNYRETILLRFGLGLTVPELAAHFGISEAAAKKRVLRAGRQVRKRMAQVEGEEFCPQMRELARGFAFEREAAGLASAAEGEALRAHFSHCGSCRSYLVRLRAELHELGSGALAALIGGERIAGHLELLHRVGHWAGAAADGVQGAFERLRHLALRGTAPFSSGEGAAGAAMGTGQKIAALCGAGAAATATCVLSGAVGPVLGAATHHPDRPLRPAAKVKRLSSQEAPAAEPAQNPPAAPSASPVPEADTGSGDANSTSGPAAGEPAPPAPPQSAEVVPEEHAEAPPPSEFGIESGSSSSTESPSATSSPSGGEVGSEFGGGSSSSGGSGSSGSAASPGGSVGFQG